MINQIKNTNFAETIKTNLPNKSYEVEVFSRNRLDNIQSFKNQMKHQRDVLIEKLASLQSDISAKYDNINKTSVKNSNEIYEVIDKEKGTTIYSLYLKFSIFVEK